MKKFAVKNIRSMFAMSTPNSFCKHEVAVAIFVNIWLLLSAKIKGLSNRNGLLHSCCNLSLATWRGDSLSCIYTLIFCYMPNSTKNASKVNNSIRTSTADSPKTAIYKRFQEEKALKNQAYLFILLHDLLIPFAEFAHRYPYAKAQEGCISLLSNLSK